MDTIKRMVFCLMTLAPIVAWAQATIPAPRPNVNGLAYDGTDLYVVEAASGGTEIDRIDPANGALLGSYFAPDADGNFDGTVSAWDLAYDGAGRFFFNVGSQPEIAFPSSPVIEFDTAGSTVFASFVKPFRGSGIAFDGSKLYVADVDSSDVRVYSPSGSLIDTITLAGFRPGALTFDPLSGYLYAEDLLGDRVGVFTTSGAPVDTWTGPQKSPPFNNSGIEIVGSDLYVVGSTVAGGDADTIFIVDTACGNGRIEPGEICEPGTTPCCSSSSCTPIDNCLGVEAKKLIVVDKLTVASTAKAVFVAADGAITKGAGTDPGTISASFDLAYDGEAGRFSVPTGVLSGSAGWKVNTDAVAKYVNKDAPGGATQAKVMVIKPGKLLKIVTKGLGDTDLLDVFTQGPPSASLFTAYCIDNAGETYCHCTKFTTCTHKPIAAGTGAKLVCKAPTLPNADCTAITGVGP